MRLEELVGKKVIRTKSNERGDCSYMNFDIYDYIECVDVIDGVPLVKRVSNTICSSCTVRPISCMFNDNNWIDVTNAYNRLVELNNSTEVKNG